ncbi:gastrula zinc finger protein XlCGF7.1-like [Drosophila kikkawai]|uniref:Gastrula zinc finger protein XlCGF7.1-like n=1 Tax=Drosophila kikkawai TaxID=30033 RepID=A0A6P4JM22_DROKI|nr:gastrula zinc finger protein XlCGF64.1-like [Drosophila kikkawai]
MEVKSCHDAPNGFGIMQSYDTLYRQDEVALHKENQLEEEVYDNERGTRKRFQLLEQVKNEPIENDFLMKDHLFNQSYQVKEEDLKDHIQSDYPVNGTIFYVKNNNMEEQQPFKCTHCPKSFLQKPKLQRHIKTHSGERPYTCSYCQASFSRSEHLQRHVRKHTGERPYSCTLCQSAFTRKEHLQRHTRTHTGERPYQCGYCQESFLKKEHLQRHLRIHTGERPYQCNHCQESFSRSEHLQRHIQSHKEGE